MQVQSFTILRDIATHGLEHCGGCGGGSRLRSCTCKRQAVECFWSLRRSGTHPCERSGIGQRRSPSSILAATHPFISCVRQFVSSLAPVTRNDDAEQIHARLAPALIVCLHKRKQLSECLREPNNAVPACYPNPRYGNIHDMAFGVTAQSISAHVSIHRKSYVRSLPIRCYGLADPVWYNPAVNIMAMRQSARQARAETVAVQPCGDR